MASVRPSAVTDSRACNGCRILPSLCTERDALSVERDAGAHDGEPVPEPMHEFRHARTRGVRRSRVRHDAAARMRGQPRGDTVSRNLREGSTKAPEEGVLTGITCLVRNRRAGLFNRRQMRGDGAYIVPLAEGTGANDGHER